MATEEITVPLTAPRATPRLLYYGWVNVVMGALAMTATLPGRTHGLGLITKPLLEDLRMPEQVFSYLNFWAILLGTLVAWPIAWLVDRWGTRLVGGLIILSLGASVAVMSQVRDELPLFLCLFLVRGLGQGALSVAATAMVGKWFGRRIGLAMGVFAMLLGFGFVVSTPSFQYAVEQQGWRDAWLTLGLLLACGLGPITLLLVRGVPTAGESDEFNSEPARGVNTGAGAEIREGEPPIILDRRTNDKNATLLDALCSSAFWVYSIACSMFGLIWSAIMLFYQTILEERGFGSDTYRVAMAIFVGVGLLANLLGGWGCRYWPMGRWLGIGLMLLAASLAAFPFVTEVWQVIAFTAVFGAAGGIITVIYFAFYGRAFGQSQLGRIQGTAHVFSVFASAIGPVLLTWSRQATGAYDPFFYWSVPVLVALGLVAWLTPIPSRRPLEA